MLNRMISIGCVNEHFSKNFVYLLIVLFTYDPNSVAGNFERKV